MTGGRWTELHCRPAGATASTVRVGRGLRAQLAEWSAGRRTFAIVDERVAARHPQCLGAAWAVEGVAGGEGLKTLPRAERTLSAMARAGIDRQGLLLAIGGGSVGDFGGLCGGLWLRGIETWQVPTTLLAMVDSSVGGKTAVNLPEGKNLVGLVHPPALVVADVEFAADLPDVEIDCGLAEAAKMGIGVDAELFTLLERHGAAARARDLAVLEDVVTQSLAAKAAVVEGDLREAGPRRVLNLGHTLGHALEAHSGFARPHGLCVAQGLWFALDVARALRAIAPADAARCEALLESLGHARAPRPPAAELLPFLRRDKKAADDVVHFVVPTGVGRSEVRPLAIEQLATLLAR